MFFVISSVAIGVLSAVKPLLHQVEFRLHPPPPPPSPPPLHEDVKLVVWPSDSFVHLATVVTVIVVVMFVRLPHLSFVLGTWQNEWIAIYCTKDGPGPVTVSDTLCAAVQIFFILTGQRWYGNGDCGCYKPYTMRPKILRLRIFSHAISIMTASTLINKYKSVHQDGMIFSFSKYVPWKSM